MRSAAKSHVKMAKVSRRVPYASVRGSLTQKRSPNQPVYIDVAQERREVRYFEHKHPDFF